MGKLVNLPASVAGLVLGLAAIGAVTALAVSGSITGMDAEVVIVGLVSGGAGVVGAHVGGIVATTAAGTVQAPPVPPQAAPGA